MRDPVPPPSPAGPAGSVRRLDSWGEIAAYLHRSVSTVQRWENQEGLPVHRIAHSKLGSVFGLSDELDAWRESRRDVVSGPAPAVDAASGRIALAVLPFQNLSGPDQDYFSDGLTEELITQLARLRPDRLAVIARTSAMQYRNTTKDVRTVGAELGAGYILEGGVRRGNDRVRVTAQLISTGDGTHLWAESYEQPLTDVIAIQTGIAERVADSLRIHLLSEQHAAHAQARRTSPEARDAYLKGRYCWYLRTPEDFGRALAYYQRAAELDPNFAPAHAGLADAYAALGFWAHGVLAPREAFPRAREAADRALSLDPGLAEAYATLGFVQFGFDWDWAAAQRSFRRAQELNPSYATGHQWYALCLALQGRAADALAESARAQALDPLALVVMDISAGWLHYFARDYEQARVQFARTLEMNPSLRVTRLLLASAHCFSGRAEEAMREHDTFDRLHGATTIGIVSRACHQALAGQRREAEEGLAALHRRAASAPVHSWHFAVVHASLGAVDEAFAALERALEERSDALAYLKVEPHWDPLRGDPRFGELLKRVGLA
jgi:TolB-like protein/tetratricopeptide (TPR) repeat protein